MRTILVVLMFLGMSGCAGYKEIRDATNADLTVMDFCSSYKDKQMNDACYAWYHEERVKGNLPSTDGNNTKFVLSTVEAVGSLGLVKIPYPAVPDSLQKFSVVESLIERAPSKFDDSVVTEDEENYQ